MRNSHEAIMDGNEAGWEEATGVDGVTRIFGYVPAALPPKDFFLSAGQSKSEVSAVIDRATWHGIGFILAGCFAAIFIGWAGGRRLVRRLIPDQPNDRRRGAPNLDAPNHLKARASQSGAFLLACGLNFPIGIALQIEVPEPSSLALLVVGLIAIGALRRRQRASMLALGIGRPAGAEPLA
jgi:PEP-CTERM motif